MKKFLRDFKNYFLAYDNYGATALKFTFGTFILPFAFFIALSAITSCFYTQWRLDSVFVPIEMIWLFGSVVMASRRNISPTLIHSLPISYKKRVAFDFILSFLFTVILVVAMLVVSLLMSLVFLALDGFFSGEFVEETEEVVSVASDPYGIAFVILSNMTIFLVGMIYSSYSDKKEKAIFCVVVCLAYFAGAVIVANLTMHGFGFEGFFVKTNVVQIFSYMPMPWLAILLQALCVCGLGVFAVYKDVRLQRPLKY